MLTFTELLPARKRVFSIVVKDKAQSRPSAPRLQKIAPLNNAVGMGRSFVVLGHGLIFAVNGDDIDGEVFGFVAKSSLLLADGLAVVFGASPEVNGYGIGFHTYRHGRFSLICFR